MCGDSMSMDADSSRKRKRSSSYMLPLSPCRWWNCLFACLIMRANIARVEGRYDPLECQTIDNTWNALTTAMEDAMDASSGRLVLCAPLRITDCPASGYTLETNNDMALVCHNREQQGKEWWLDECAIDCSQGRHFTVNGGASLTLESMTLMSAVDSSIVVKPNGTLLTYNTDFRDNRHTSGNGGAIRGNRGVTSQIGLVWSRFSQNAALNGGAIHHSGTTTMLKCTFANNTASNGSGGAIFHGVGSKLRVEFSEFVNNTSNFFGPAIFDGSGAGDGTLKGNIACGNDSCDGVFRFAESKCMPFDFNSRALFVASSNSRNTICPPQLATTPSR